MIIRHIEKQEIDTFVQLYKHPGYQYWIKQALNKKETRPEWCFVIEENRKPEGSVIYFQYEGHDSEMSVRGLSLPWEENYSEIGEKLLTDSMDKVRTPTIKKIEFRCDTGHKYHKEMIALFEKLGYTLSQDKFSYLLSEFDTAYDYSKQLVFKTLHKVGEKEFIDAIKRVTVNTLDRGDKNDLELLGAEDLARESFNIFKSIEYNPHHWILAYNTTGDLIGLVIAQNFSGSTGCVNYIGVVPEQRGKNYSRDLILKASEILRKASAVERILAEIDTKNFPLERTLLSLHYKISKTMWIYYKYF